MKRKPSQTLEEYIQEIYEIEMELEYSYKNMKMLEKKYNLSYLAYSALNSKFKNSRPKCYGDRYTSICPILATHDTFEQAHYHIHECIVNYHNPTQFRFNLNAFIQSLRNITFSLQSEKKNFDNFDSWYKEKQAEMKSNQLLKNFVEGRNTVVKRGMLETKSKVSSGLFKYGREKACVIHEVSPFLESEKIFEVSKKVWIPGFVSEEHIFIGEEIGIKREWIVESISENEIIEECNNAWIVLGNLVGEAHDILGYDFIFSDYCHKDYKDFQVMTESQLDPTLPEK